MRAMILAAGFGERLKPLTNTIPKPLLKVGDKPLIFHHLESLSKVGIKEVVINVSYLAEKIIAACKDGSQFGLNISYSIEEEPLETGGGIYKARELLGNEPFLVVNSDLYTDYPFAKILDNKTTAAHLVFVDNPDFNPNGDYGLNDRIVLDNSQEKLTYAGIGIFNPMCFAKEFEPKFKLTKILNPLISEKKITGEHYNGVWFNIGTKDILAQAQAYNDV